MALNRWAVSSQDEFEGPGLAIRSFGNSPCLPRSSEILVSVCCQDGPVFRADDVDSSKAVNVFNRSAVPIGQSHAESKYDGAAVKYFLTKGNHRVQVSVRDVAPGHLSADMSSQVKGIGVSSNRLSIWADAHPLSKRFWAFPHFICG